jgi:hypothetical protein
MHTLFKSLAPAAWAITCAAGTMASAQATALYANFDATAATPDYSSTQYADISAYCASAFCPFINVFSASFSFTPQVSGLAAHAYLPLQALSTVAGMERFYRISLLNSQGEVVVQGGMLGRSVPLGAMGVHEFALDRATEAGQLLAASDELTAGQTYTAVFSQRFGSMSQTHWMSSGDAAAPGQATASCSPNVPGSCAFWNGSWQPVFATGSTAPLAFLPGLALTDGNGFAAASSGGAVPEPTSWVLALTALAAAAMKPLVRLQRRH